ncbi:hypothetical protein [Kribbella sp. NPDC004875]|uniref:hypothetical protein n=1 Tax=Kribbella sp. NPDC004875 TaxID=3364107 RepID=UPI0036804045
MIVDIVGGPELPMFLDRLAPNGRLVLAGAVAGFPPNDFGMSLGPCVPAIALVRDIQSRDCWPLELSRQ